MTIQESNRFSNNNGYVQQNQVYSFYQTCPPSYSRYTTPQYYQNYSAYVPLCFPPNYSFETNASQQVLLTTYPYCWEGDNLMNVTNTTRAYDMDSLKKAIYNAKTGTGEVSRIISTCLFRPREQAFTKLINLCGRLKNSKKAEEVFEAMKLCNGIKPNFYSYSALITACNNSGNLNKSLVIFEKMKEAALNDTGCRPNQVTYSAMITGCEREGEYERAIYYFDEMQELGMMPDRVSYWACIISSQKLGLMEKASDVIDNMHVNNVVGPLEPYKQQLIYFSEKKKWKQAIDLFTNMQNHGQFVNSDCCRIMMRAFEESNRPELAYKLIKYVKNCDIAIDNETLATAQRIALQHQEFKELNNVLKDIMLISANEN